MESEFRKLIAIIFNPFLTNVLDLYPLNTTQNLPFSGVYRVTWEYRPKLG